MSVQDERDLRERLGGLLEGIEPHPAPVLRAMRQGRGIRMRRWMSAAAGIAVIAAGAVTLPIVLQGHKGPAPEEGRRHYKYTETVNPPAKNAPDGVIGSGTQDGHKWQVVVTGRGNNMTVTGSGTASMGSSAVLANPGDPIGTESVGDSGPGGSLTIFGQVRPYVTSVTIELPGKVFDLRPVRYLGNWYVGIAIPSGLPITRAVVWAGHVELAYSVPFGANMLANWWKPGQSGPARLTKTIDSGVIDGHPWRIAAQFGPWGYCYELPDGPGCISGPTPNTADPKPSADGIQPMICGGAGADSTTPMYALAAAGSDVRRVVMRLSNGSTLPVSVTPLDGARLLGYEIPVHVQIKSATTYGGASGGQVLGPVSAKVLNCAS